MRKWREILNQSQNVMMKGQIENKLVIERFSFECLKVIGFAFATLHDWLKKFAPIFHPIGSKTKTNRDSLACVFPRFASANCSYFEYFWLVHCIVHVLCEWLEQLLWFWFYDTQLKTTLNVENTRLWLVFSISLVFSNDHRVLSQCNTRLGLLYVLNKTGIKLGWRGNYKIDKTGLK